MNKRTLYNQIKSKWTIKLSSQLNKLGKVKNKKMKRHWWQLRVHTVLEAGGQDKRWREPADRDDGEGSLGQAMRKYDNVFTLASDRSHTLQPYTSHQKLHFHYNY